MNNLHVWISGEVLVLDVRACETDFNDRTVILSLLYLCSLSLPVPTGYKAGWVPVVWTLWRSEKSMLEIEPQFLGHPAP
jgi:hypothetical protein